MLTQTLNFVIRGSDRYSPVMGKFIRDVNTLGGNVGKVGVSMQSLGFALGAPAALAAWSSGLAAVPGQLLRVDHGLRQIQVIGDLTEKQMTGIGRRVRELARETNQSQEEIMEGLNDLVAKTGDPLFSMQLMESIGRTATATSSRISDLSTLAFTAINTAKLQPTQIQQAFDVMAQAGKMGSFELRAMASEFPEILAMGQWIGGTGVDMIARFSAAMQIAKRATPNDPEAVTGVRAFLNELTSGSTVSAFNNAGFNLVKFIREGMQDPSRDLLQELVDTTVALTDKDPFLNQQLFNNVRTQRFLKAMQQNREAYEEIRDASARATGVIARDFDIMGKSAEENLKKFRINVSDFGFTTLMPVLNGLNAVLQEINKSSLAVKFTVAGIGAALLGSGMLVYTGMVLRAMRDLVPVMRIILGLTNIQLAKETALAVVRTAGAMALGSPGATLAASALAGLGLWYGAKKLGMIPDSPNHGAHSPADPGQVWGLQQSAPWETPVYNLDTARAQFRREMQQNPSSVSAQKVQVDIAFANAPRGMRVDTHGSPAVDITRTMGMSFQPSLGVP